MEAWKKVLPTYISITTRIVTLAQSSKHLVFQ